MHLTRSTLYRLSISVVVALALVMFAGIWHLGNNPVIAYGLVGVFLIFLGTKPCWRHLAMTAACAAGFVALYTLTNGSHAFAAWGLVAACGFGAFLGIASIMVMTCRMVWSGAELREPFRDALVVPVFTFVGGICMGLISTVPSLHFDFVLYAYDRVLGPASGRSAAHLFRAVPWICSASSFVYRSLMIFPAFFHGWAMYRGRGRMNMMTAFAVAGVAGFLLYQICPAMGPIYAFGAGFPDRLPADNYPLGPFSGVGVNNAMPSMHMTWMLVMCVASLELGSVAAAIAFCLAGFTALATLGFGEHYLIDLVVAVPVAVLTVGICLRRWRLAGAGATIAMAWMVALRLKLLLDVPRSLNWILVIGTVASIGLIWWPGRPSATQPLWMHWRGQRREPEGFVLPLPTR